MGDEMNREEELLLKMEYGAELDAQERQELDSFLASPGANGLQREVRSMRKLLDEIDEPAGMECDLSEMRSRFEESVREQARFVRGRMRGFVLGTFGAASFFAIFFGNILPLFHPKQIGLGGKLALWIGGFVWSAIICAYLYYRLFWMQNDPDLFDRLIKIEQRTPRSLTDHLRRLPILFLAMLLMWWQDGWRTGFIGVPIIWALFVGFAYVLNSNTRRLRIAQDEELWSWWYGDVHESLGRK